MTVAADMTSYLRELWLGIFLGTHPAHPGMLPATLSRGVASEQHGFDDECRHCPISLEVFQLYRCFKSTVGKLGM